MKDEELKGMIVNNTAVPLQDGITLTPPFETAKEEVNRESGVSPLGSSIKSGVVENHIDSGSNTEKPQNIENKLTFENDVLSPAMNAGKNPDSLDAEADNLLASIMQDKLLKNDDSIESELPQVTIENPDEFHESTEGNGFELPNVGIASPVQPTDNGVEIPVVNSELPEVTIEDPNQIFAPTEENKSGVSKMGTQIELPAGNISNKVEMPVVNQELPEIPIENLNQLNPIGEPNNNGSAIHSVEVNSNSNGVTPLGADVLLDEAFQVQDMNTTVNVANGISEVVPATSSDAELANMVVQTTPIQESIPNMQANPNIEPSIHLSDDSDDYQETPYYMVEEAPKTKEDLELEKRNGSGIRFIIIFGLIVLIFIILLPYISGLL